MAKSQRRLYKNEAEAIDAKRIQNRAWYEPFSASRLPWRVVVNGEIVACFAIENDALGFTMARYKDGFVEARTKAKPSRRRNFKEISSETEFIGNSKNKKEL